MIVVGSLLTLGVCAFAVSRGGEAERAIGIVALVVLFGSLAAQAILGRQNAWPVVAADLALGVAFGLLAAIHMRVWLFVECAVASALLLVHGVMLEAHGAVTTPVYAVAVDGLNLVMLGTLAVAVLQTRPGVGVGAGATLEDPL